MKTPDLHKQGHVILHKIGAQTLVLTVMQVIDIRMYEIKDDRKWSHQQSHVIVQQNIILYKCNCEPYAVSSEMSTCGEEDAVTADNRKSCKYKVPGKCTPTVGVWN